ncbi:MAG: hypothetical protein COA62_10900 [Rhodobiaceae bacterium]|nr:MAG: hypothetical protein COA62_10900 [Rhodobiaceae bacterium]
MKPNIWLSVFVTILVVAVLYASFRTGESVKIDALRAETPGLSLASLPNGETRYQLEGPEQGDVILLIHGGREPGWTWDEVVPSLHAAGFQTLRYDMFGRGYSDRPTDGAYDQAFYLQQAEDLLDALKLTGPVHVAGYSFGAAIATRLAAARPAQVRSLSLLAPRYFGYPVPAVVYAPVIGNLLIKYYVKPNALDEVRSFFTTAQLRDKYLNRVGEPADVVGNYMAFRRFALSDALAGTEEIYNRLGKLDKPILVLSGEDDAGITADHIDAIAALVPGARRVALPNANHGLVWQHGETVAQEMIRHMRSVLE